MFPLAPTTTTRTAARYPPWPPSTLPNQQKLYRSSFSGSIEDALSLDRWSHLLRESQSGGLESQTLDYAKLILRSRCERGKVIAFELASLASDFFECSPQRPLSRDPDRTQASHDGDQRLAIRRDLIYELCQRNAELRALRSSGGSAPASS